MPLHRTGLYLQDFEQNQTPEYHCFVQKAIEQNFLQVKSLIQSIKYKLISKKKNQGKDSIRIINEKKKKKRMLELFY